MLNSAKDSATNKTAPRRARALAFESLRAGFRKALKRSYFCLTAALLETIPAWPQEVPITVCVFRQDPFGGALDEIVRGKTINNREVLARRANELPNLKRVSLFSLMEEKTNFYPRY